MVYIVLSNFIYMYLKMETTISKTPVSSICSISLQNLPVYLLWVVYISDKNYKYYSIVK